MPIELVQPVRPRPKGGAGTLITGGILNDNQEHNSDLEGDRWFGTPSSAGIADKMIRDSHVRMSMEYVTGPLRAASWEFEPGGSSDVEKEAADFCNWCFFRRLSFDRFLREVLTYKIYGFSMFEVTDDIERIPAKFTRHPGGGRRCCHHRPASPACLDNASVDPEQAQPDNPPRVGAVASGRRRGKAGGSFR